MSSNPISEEETEIEVKSCRWMTRGKKPVVCACRPTWSMQWGCNDKLRTTGAENGRAVSFLVVDAKPASRDAAASHDLTVLGAKEAREGINLVGAR
jgi:hypothetical protein